MKERFITYIERSLPDRPGDKILFDKYAGTSVKVGADEFLIIDAKDILAVLE